MALMLGKRKRRKDLSDQESSHSLEDADEINLDALQARLREHFEAQFAPLDELVPPNRSQAQVRGEDDSKSDVESDWRGISDDEGISPHVVEHQSTEARKGETPLGEFKSFMTSRPPSFSSTKVASSSSSSNSQKRQRETSNPDDAAAAAAEESANLKNDIALQRLLRESHHLLDLKSSSPLMPLSVHNRHKALDLRLQEVGAKSSIHAQRKMPLAQRTGIAKMKVTKEERRRKEAKQNGIILEVPAANSNAKGKKAPGKGKGKKRRERSVGTPSVGHFERGMLKLSKRDVAKIEGGPKRRRK